MNCYWLDSNLNLPVVLLRAVWSPRQEPEKMHGLVLLVCSVYKYIWPLMLQLPLDILWPDSCSELSLASWQPVGFSHSWALGCAPPPLLKACPLHMDMRFHGGHKQTSQSGAEAAVAAAETYSKCSPFTVIKKWRREGEERSWTHRSEREP